jgi:drug/metabolite transporter (DMT)-like permease
MTWFLVGFLMPLLFALADVERRKILQGRPVMVVTAICFTYLALSLALTAALFGVAPLTSRSWLSIAITAPLNWLGVFSWFAAISSTTPLAVVVSCSAIAPVLTLFTSYVILGEIPPTIGCLAVVLVALGVYIQHARGAGSLLAPFRLALVDTGTRMAILSCLCASISSPVDKLGTTQANLAIYLAIQSAIIALAMHTQCFLLNRSAHRLALRQFVSTYWRIGLLWPVGCTLYLFGIISMPIGYVHAFRMLGIIPVALIGWFSLREKPNAFQVGGSLVMLIGALIIVITK